MKIPDKFTFTVPNSPLKPSIIYNAKKSNSGDTFEVTWKIPFATMNRTQIITMAEMKMYLEAGTWVINNQNEKHVDSNNLFSLEDL